MGDPRSTTRGFEPAPDDIINRLFLVGLGLNVALGWANGRDQTTVRDAIDELELTIREIRVYVLDNIHGEYADQPAVTAGWVSGEAGPEG